MYENIFTVYEDGKIEEKMRLMECKDELNLSTAG